MKVLILPLVTLAMWLIPASVMAQKIGVIDMQEAVIGSTEGKKAEAKFTVREDELSKDLDRRKKEIDDAQNKLKSQDKALSAEAKADLTRNIDRMQKDLTRVTDDAQKELDDLRNELLRPIAEFVSQIVSAYSSQMGYSVMLDLSSPQNQSLIYHDAKLDVTAEVIKIVDAQIAAQKPASDTAKPGVTKPAPPAPAKAPSTGVPGAPKAPPQHR